MNKRKRSFLSLFISPIIFLPLPAKAETNQLPHFIPLPSIQAARHILSLFYPALWRGAHQQRPRSRVLILARIESRYTKKNSTARNSKPPISPKATLAKHSKHNSDARHGETQRDAVEQFRLGSPKRFPSVFSHNAKPRRTRKNQALRGCIPYFPANMGASL
jgi:hypothetical protein